MTDNLRYLNYKLGYAKRRATFFLNRKAKGLNYDEVKLANALHAIDVFGPMVAEELERRKEGKQ